MGCAPAMCGIHFSILPCTMLHHTCPATTCLGPRATAALTHFCIARDRRAACLPLDRFFTNNDIPRMPTHRSRAPRSATRNDAPVDATGSTCYRTCWLLRAGHSHRLCGL